MDLGLAGRTYVVTGGSSGLGLATAETLVAEGANVVLGARSRDRLSEAVTSLGAAQAEGVVADLGDPAAPDLLLGAARARFGRLDGVLISVGGPPPGSVSDTTDEQWRNAFETVFLGAVRVATTLGEAMAADSPADSAARTPTGTGGAITFLLSTSSRVPIPGLAASNGLRPGLAMVAKQLANDLGPRGVRVLGVMPGRVATERVAELDALSGDQDAARARWEQQIPLRRYGEPAELGRVTAFLLSPAASFVNGAMIPVDGGLLPTP